VFTLALLASVPVLVVLADPAVGATEEREREIARGREGEKRRAKESERGNVKLCGDVGTAGRNPENAFYETNLNEEEDSVRGQLKFVFSMTLLDSIFQSNSRIANRLNSGTK
jgi:hypothetical protein